MMKVWDLESGYCKKTVGDYFSEWIRCCDSNKDYIIAAGLEKRIYVFEISRLILDFNKNEDALVNDFEAHDNDIEAIKINKMEKETKNLCVTASRDKKVGVWDYIKGELIVLFVGHENWVKSVSFLESS